jgi:hypothetical protein
LRWIDSGLFQSLLHRRRRGEIFQNRQWMAARGLALRFAQTDTRSPSVFIDEFDPRGFQGSADHIQRRSSWRVNVCLKLADSNDAHSSMLSQIGLAPIN